MHYTLSTFIMALPLVAAWPAVMEAVNLENLQKRQGSIPVVPPPRFTTDRDNCGSHGKCTVFNAQDQLVNVASGSGHEWQAPGTNDKRAQCPGLNAAANHAFLPRNGIATIQQSMSSLCPA